MPDPLPKLDPDNPEIIVPKYDPLKHAGHVIGSGTPGILPADVPFTFGRDTQAPKLVKVGPGAYYQKRGDGGWPPGMGDNEIKRLLRVLAAPDIWKTMWAAHRQGMRESLGELGTIVVSQYELTRLKHARVSFVPKSAIANGITVDGKKFPLEQVKDTIGGKYDHIHDIHVTIILDSISNVPYNPDAPVKVQIITNRKRDDLT